MSPLTTGLLPVAATTEAQRAVTSFDSLEDAQLKPSLSQGLIE